MKFFVRDDSGKETELNITVLSLKENDILVLKCNEKDISLKQFKDIFHNFSLRFTDYKCYGIVGDFDIGVIRKEKN